MKKEMDTCLTGMGQCSWKHVSLSFDLSKKSKQLELLRDSLFWLKSSSFDLSKKSKQLDWLRVWLKSRLDRIIAAGPALPWKTFLLPFFLNHHEEKYIFYWEPHFFHFYGNFEPTWQKKAYFVFHCANDCAIEYCDATLWSVAWFACDITI